MIGLPKLIPDTHTQLPPFVLQVLAAVVELQVLAAVVELQVLAAVVELQVLAAVVELQVLAAVVGGSGGLCPEWGEGKPLFGTRPEVCYR